MKSIAKKEIIYFLLFGVILLMIFYLSSVLLPFFIGVFLAYLLDPCVDYLEKCNLNRGLASIFILIIFFLGFSFITFLILPILFAQTISFLNEFPNIINELDKRFRSVLELLREKIIFIQVKDFINNIMPNLSQLAPKFLNSLISSSLALVHILGLLFITPIVTWYFLRDWDKILKKILGTLSKKYKILLLDYSNNIKLILDAYLRGQLLVSLSLCFYYSLFFYFLEDFIFLYLEGGLSIEEIAFENDSANTPYKIKLEKEAAEREARKKSRKRSEPCEGGFFEGIDLKTGRVKCRWAWEG